MRLFTGIEIGEEAVVSAAAAARDLRGCVERAELGSEGKITARWVPSSNLHITLWFIGEVAGTPEEPSACRSIVEAMAPRFETARFVVELGGLGIFPQSGPPRVFWMGVRSGAESLLALYGEVTARLRPLGFEPERRPYSAHVTLARVKAADRGKFHTLRAAVRVIPAGPVSTPVNAVTVFASRLSPKGPAYEPMLRVPLS